MLGKLNLQYLETEIVKFGIARYLHMECFINIANRKRLLTLQRSFLLWHQIYQKNPQQIEAVDGAIPRTTISRGHHEYSGSESANDTISGYEASTSGKISALSTFGKYQLKLKLRLLYKSWNIWKFSSKLIEIYAKSDKNLQSQLTRMKMDNERLRDRITGLMALVPGANSSEEVVIPVATSLIRGSNDHILHNNSRQRLRKLFLRALTLNNFNISLKEYFQKWRSFSYACSFNNDMRKQRAKIEIGIQFVESEREIMKETKLESIKLKSWLMCALFFMKWKVSSVVNQLESEKTARYQERKKIITHVENLKKRLFVSQKLEQDAVAAGLLRGGEYLDNLLIVQNNLERSVKDLSC